jgi:hypothetical protein
VTLVTCLPCYKRAVELRASGRSDEEVTATLRSEFSSERDATKHAGHRDARIRARPTGNSLIRLPLAASRLGQSREPLRRPDDAAPVRPVLEMAQTSYVDLFGQRPWLGGDGAVG